MCDTNLTRRQLLRRGALFAATVPALALVSQGESFAAALERSRKRAAQASGLAVPMHLELVTVTDTEAVMTWFTCDPTDIDEFGRPRPVPAPGRVLIGTSPDPRTWREVGVHGPTPFHYVHVGDLTAGTTYYWRAESSGIPAVPTVIFNGDPMDTVAPPSFTTLVPPPGRELGSVAWFNDLHFGEHVAGLAISNPDLPRGGLPPGFPVDPDHPYWRFMSRNAVAEAKSRGMTLLLANGDLTNEAEPDALDECRSTLDVFGAIGGSVSTHSPGRADLRPGDAPAYFVTRGNHDRAHSGDLYAGCAPFGDDPELKDCFSDVFAPSWEPGTTHFSVTIGDDSARYRFVGLDSNDGSATGVLRAGELDYLEQELGRGDITIPLFHHPASDLAGASQVPPFGGLVADSEAFRAVVAKFDNVGGVYAGHTHRNNRSLGSGTGAVPYFEGGAVKEYPGGYTQVRLFEGGYMVNFFKTSAPDAQAWAETTRGEYLGLAPHYQLGGFGDRNWVHNVDARRTVHAGAQASRDASDSVAGGAVGRTHPATGGTGKVAAAGVAAAAGFGLRRLAGRHHHSH